jgi:hypothetical protein
MTMNVRGYAAQSAKDALAPFSYAAIRGMTTW